MRILVQALVAAPGGSLTVLRDLVAAWPEGDELLIVCWRDEAADALRAIGHQVLQVQARSTEHGLLRVRVQHHAEISRFRPEVIWSQAVRVGGFAAPQAVHYQDIGSFEAIHPRTLRQRIKSLREYQDLRRVDLRIYNSATLRDAAHARFPIAAVRRHVVVHNGLDLTPFEAEPIYPPSVMRDPTSRSVMLPQMDAPHKRNWLAADVLALLREQNPDMPPLRLTVVGRGTYSDLRERLAHHGLAETATFTGFVTRKEMAGLYATSDAVLMTGRAESFGNPIIEAHATGRPVVTPPFLIAHELRGPLSHIAPTDDAPGLAGALSRALDRTLEKDRIQDARRFAGAFSSIKASKLVRVAVEGIVHSATLTSD